jgi:thiol-disulfide isomerase/thioredoxin
MKKNILAIGVVGLLFAAIGLYFGKHQAESESISPNSDAVISLLSQSLPDSTGTVQPLSKWKGKALLVNFWAPWCAPCVEEMPELTALQIKLAPDVQILGIGIDSAANIAEFAAKYKIAYPLYVAGIEGTELIRKFGNQAGGLPFTVLIDQNGKIKKTYLGRLKMAEIQHDLDLLQGNR